MLGIPHETLGAQIGLEMWPPRHPAEMQMPHQDVGRALELLCPSIPHLPKSRFLCASIEYLLPFPVSHVSLQILSAHVPRTRGRLPLRWALAVPMSLQPCCGAEVPPNPPVAIQVLHAEPRAGRADPEARWDTMTSPP